MKPLPNEVIKENIIEQLAWNDNINTSDVYVDVKGKKVFLKGTVNSYSSKLEAARETMLVAQNYDIENQLEVKFIPKETIPNDHEIVENIQNSLKWNDGINPLNLQVDSEKGRVTLSGTVSRSREKTKAEDIANSSKGVVDVYNKITVKPSAVRSDSEIEKEVTRAFERNPLIDTVNVYVDVNKGIIHLSGTVANEIVRNEIRDIALYTKGVVDITDEIVTG